MWKKIFRVFGVLLLSPFLLSAVNPHQAYYPKTDTTTKTTDSTALNLDTNNLNFSGPITVGLQYSQLFGYFLKLKYAQLLSFENALAFDLEGGRNEYRLNATVAHAFTPQKRLKISAEHLAQRKTFDFLSGAIDQRVRQNALGVTYQYLIPHSHIHDVYINAFYSHAQSQNLSDLPMPKQPHLINLRHIAGGTDKSINAGITVRPSANNQLGAELNYDQIRYRTLYEGNKYDQAGFGATFSFDQLLSQKTKLSLLAKQSALEHDYQVGIHQLLNSAPGTRLEMGFTGERLLNSDGLPNDWQLGADITYSWGGRRLTLPATYSFGPESSLENLVHWAGTPAIYMNQVLAVKDEAVKPKSSPAWVPQDVRGFRYPTHNPEFSSPDKPKVVTGVVGQPLHVEWKALANVDKSGMFYDVDSHFNSLQLNIAEINQKLDSAHSGLTAALRTGTTEEEKYLVIESPMVKATAQTAYPLVIRAQNLRNAPDFTDPPEVQYITIQIQSGKEDPQILDVKPQLFNFEEPNETNTLATIVAGSQTIRKGQDIMVTIDNKPISNAGLHLVLTPDQDIAPNSTATVSLAGTSQLETYTTLNGLINVTPQQSGKSVSQPFTFNSRGRPQMIQSSIGEYEASPNQSWTTNINLDNAFQNTTPDAPGNMTYAVNTSTTSAGIHGKIQGNILQQVSVDSDVIAGDYYLKIHAQNNQDALKAQHWSQQDTTYTVHVKINVLVTISCPHTVTINPTTQQATGIVTSPDGNYTFTTKPGSVSDPTYQEDYVSVAYYYPTKQTMECQIYYKTQSGQTVDSPDIFTAIVPHDGETFDPTKIGFVGSSDPNYCNNPGPNKTKFCDFQYHWVQK